MAKREVSSCSRTVSSGLSRLTSSSAVKKTASSSRTNSDAPTAVILYPSCAVFAQVRTIHSASRTSIRAPGVGGLGHWGCS
ncbi:hypothetical protein ACFQ0B_23835 [Nonomuraea thailandensis]